MFSFFSALYLTWCGDIYLNRFQIIFFIYLCTFLIMLSVYFCAPDERALSLGDSRVRLDRACHVRFPMHVEFVFVFDTEETGISCRH